MTRTRSSLTAALCGLILGAVTAGTALAHCDTMDGPVVRDARTAIEKRDLTPVLKWIGPGDETEVRGAFARTLAVRDFSADAKDLEKRIRALPGFGDMKVLALSAVLAKRFDVEVAKPLAPSFPTLGDVDSVEALHEYQATKRAYRSARRAEAAKA